MVVHHIYLEKLEEGKKAALSEKDELVAAQMQLRMLAAVPSLQQPLRDPYGRRRSTCVSHSKTLRPLRQVLAVV